MASTLKVDTIQTNDGTGTIALQNQLSGMTSASMPTGSVLQVVQVTRTNTQNSGFLLTTTSSSWTAASLSAAITPSSTSSKILVQLNISVHHSTTLLTLFMLAVQILVEVHMD